MYLVNMDVSVFYDRDHTLLLKINGNNWREILFKEIKKKIFKKNRYTE